MKSEKKKLIPAISVFVFVAFSFVVANAFGDTYAASCPSGYIEISSVCCLEGASGYDSVSGRCAAVYDRDTNSCPNDKWKVGSTGNGAQLSYFCWAEPVEKIIEPTEYTVTLKAEDAIIDDNIEAKEYDETHSVTGSTFNYANYEANKDGATFTGWGEKNCSVGTKTGTIDLTTNLTLYACFTQNSSPTSYTVTFSANGSNITGPNGSRSDSYSENFTSGATLDYSKYRASNNENGEFSGWSTSSQLTNCSKTGTKTITSSITLYACYSGGGTVENEKEVTFDPNGGQWSDGSTYSKKVSFVSDTMQLPTNLTKKDSNGNDCTLEGWKTANGKLLTKYVDSEEDGTTVTASWNCDNSSGSGGNEGENPPPETPTTHTVNFYDELGDELGTETVNSGETISDFPSFKYPELENFWSDSASCDSGYEFNENIAIVSDLELYQCYSEGFIVKFYDENREYLNEVEVFPVDIVIPEDEIPNLDNGYDGFWSESKMCESKFDVEDEVIVEDTKLYACYIYDIYFYGLDENEEYEKIGSSTFFNGYTLYDVENIPDEDDLLIDGKVFTHWSTSSNSCDENDMLEPEEILPLSLDGVNLYACYTSGEAILVRFNDMNSNKYAEIQVVKGTSINDTVESTGINIPTAPTVEGYTFRFWSNGSNCSKGYNFDNKVEQPLTLTACYNKNATSSGTTDDNVDNNPGTGSFMLYIVFLVGILSLGYTGYSVIKVTKKNN